MSQRQGMYAITPTPPKGGLRVRASEHQIQEALFQWAAVNRVQWPELDYFYAIPNGAMRSQAQSIWFLAEGMKKGVPDTCLPVPRGAYSGLYLELKAVGGKPSKEQWEWLDFLNAQGHLALMVFGLDEAIAALTAYLEFPKPKGLL